MAELEFDAIAGLIGETKVVSFRCYVSEPLSRDRDREYCLVADSWFENLLFVKHDDVVAQLPGSAQPDGKSVVWVREGATITNAAGDDANAKELAIDVGLEDAASRATGAEPPPPRYPL